MGKADCPKITGCIVTYNNSDKIERVIESILRQTEGINFSLIISDNHSEDNTANIVKSRFPQVTVIENPTNGGFGKANNAAIPLLDSDYHFIINPDIFLSYDAVSAFVEYFESHSDVVMAVPKLLYEDGTEQFTPKRTPTLKYMLAGRLERFGGIFKRWRDEYTLRGENVTEPFDCGFCSGCFICIRTDIFKKIGGFDERYFLYSEDADLTREAQKYGRTVYLPQISVTHLWERAYMKSGKYFFIQISSMIKYFLKWRRGGL
ncbi:MAG: glycosyltransferase family 2 protein [Oscillospiraceae bacterium]|nr:glycosyltransferase family 2 protein [Oscillospiraceae bacterium]